LWWRLEVAAAVVLRAVVVQVDFGQEQVYQ
jgi:hypothetical protein